MERRQFLFRVLGVSAAAVSAVAATQAEAASRLLDSTLLSTPSEGVQIAQASPIPSGTPDQSGPIHSASRPARPKARGRRKMRRRMRRHSMLTNESDPVGTKTPE